MPSSRKVLASFALIVALTGCARSSSHPDNPLKVATHSVERGAAGIASHDGSPDSNREPRQRPRSTSTVPVLTRVLEVTRQMSILFATTTTQPAITLPRVPISNAYPPSFQPCDGDYPPCWRVATESGGNYNAFNASGCGGAGCFGKWQFSGEWAGKLGLPLDLRTATPAEQDNAARILWAHGAGCSNWSAC